jgi:hypothetical protein
MVQNVAIERMTNGYVVRYERSNPHPDEWDNLYVMHNFVARDLDEAFTLVRSAFGQVPDAQVVA